jgi:hypothetical protein
MSTSMIMSSILVSGHQSSVVSLRSVFPVSED